MVTALRVVLYGDTVVLAGVGASLKKFPRIQIIHLDISSATTPEKLTNLHPDVVLLDLGVVKTDFAFALLRERPDLLLIGLDPGGDRLLALSGHQARALTTEDLMRLIVSRAEPAENEQAGPGRAVTLRDPTS